MVINPRRKQLRVGTRISCTLEGESKSGVTVGETEKAKLDEAVSSELGAVTVDIAGGA